MKASILGAMAGLAVVGLALPATTPAAAQGTPGEFLGRFGNWQAYKTRSGADLSCFALTEPTSRLPEGLNRDSGFLFVTQRPEAETGEISVIFGYPLDPARTSRITVGDVSYTLVSEGGSAWLADEGEQPQVVGAFRRGASATVVAVSRRGNETTDEYSLMGFTKALEAITQACDGSDANS